MVPFPLKLVARLRLALQAIRVGSGEAAHREGIACTPMVSGRRRSVSQVSRSAVTYLHQGLHPCQTLTTC